jgi:predicted RNase H-like nuclease
MLIGVDGCRDAWIAVSRSPGRRDIRWRRVGALAELFADAHRPTVVGVDIPIGLMLRGPRACDGEARRRLGSRACCVFTPPLRPMLDAPSYTAASALRREIEGKGVTKQAWGIVPKIAEVDRLLRRHPAYRPIVREVHPEVSFWMLNGKRPIAERKTSPAGQQRRVALLRGWCDDAIVRALADRRALGCRADDIVDAFVTLWTAERIHHGRAITLPGDPPRDTHGLNMEIVV